MKHYKLQKQLLQKHLKQIGVTNQRVLSTLKHVHREDFLPDHLKALAYLDVPLTLNENQTISQPSLVGLMTQELNPQPMDRLLEVGTGSAYQTAILAQMSQKVFTIEVRAGLSISAQSVLKKLGYKNIQFKISDGSLGWEEVAPFDGIMVTAAASEIPQALFAQLKPTGRMVIPLKVDEEKQDLLLITKSEQGMNVQKLMSVRFVPLIHQDPLELT